MAYLTRIGHFNIGCNICYNYIFDIGCNICYNYYGGIMKFKIKEDINYYKLISKKSDNDIAELLRISRMTLSRWIKGDKVSFDNLEKIYSMIFDEKIYINKLKEELYMSYEGNNSIILFHGAKGEIVGNPSIKYSGTNKDFGKGFYLGTSIDQASSFVSTYSESSVYIYKLNNIKNLRIKEFSVSEEWMLLIAYFRGNLEKYKDSKKIKELLLELEGIDIIIAPIADNTMYSIMNDFLNGEITNLQCLYALSANRLGKQYVLLNDNIIDNNLEFLERCYVCKKEREEYVKKREIDSKIGREKVLLAKREYAAKGKYIEELLND